MKNAQNRKTVSFTYYELEGTLDGFKEVFFGSYDKTDVKIELEAERDLLKNEGYKNIKITKRQVKEKPSLKIYGKNFNN